MNWLVGVEDNCCCVPSEVIPKESGGGCEHVRGEIVSKLREGGQEGDGQPESRPRESWRHDADPCSNLTPDFDIVLVKPVSFFVYSAHALFPLKPWRVTHDHSLPS